jgi:hypothetical protein
VIAGVNLRPFVLDWLADLSDGGGLGRSLLEEINDPYEPDSRYSYGGYMMMTNIAPLAVPNDASDEVLLFYAVMTTYQQAGWPEADRRKFDGFLPHVERAFAYFQTVGDTEAARRLAADVILRMGPEPEALERIRRHHREKNPEKSAYYERKMAEISQRDVRAAKLLDPGIDFDAMVLGTRLNGGQRPQSSSHTQPRRVSCLRTRCPPHGPDLRRAIQGETQDEATWTPASRRYRPDLGGHDQLRLGRDPLRPDTEPHITWPDGSSSPVCHHPATLRSRLILKQVHQGSPP